MPQYNNFRKYYCRSMESNSTPISSQNKEKDMDGLIIEDNTIYEIDDECIERIKKSRMNERNVRSKKYK